MTLTPKRGGREDSMPSRRCDGTRAGYEVALMAAVSGLVTMPAIDSGTAKRPDHLNAGANAVIAASTFHDGDCTVADINQVMTPEHCRSER